MTGQRYDEQPVVFGCGEDELIGVVARPAHPARRGVLIIVGGPQYRAGSHRQFVLLSRHLAAQGYAAMRFDVRGMGDSGGAPRSFEQVQDDIAAALDCFRASVPEIGDIVLWGLCDAASAALFYAHGDSRVSGLVLLNPWVRTPAGEAQAYLRHYYAQRLLSAQFWRRALQGRFVPGRAIRDMLGNVRRAFGGPGKTGLPEQPASDPGTPLPDRMAEGLARFRGKVLLVLSGNDLTAKEFTDAVAASARWRALLADPRVTRCDLDEANHTFSTRAWRDRVAQWTHDWMRSW
jgi:uncharacterized protein